MNHGSPCPNHARLHNEMLLETRKIKAPSQHIVSNFSESAPDHVSVSDGSSCSENSNSSRAKTNLCTGEPNIDAFSILPSVPVYRDITHFEKNFEY
jgi:hypothetical protein